MKKCQKCGAEYEEDKKFCKRCGSPLLEVDKNSEQNDQDGFQDWKEDNEEAGDEQQSGKKKKKNLWMGILIGLVLGDVLRWNFCSICDPGKNGWRRCKKNMRKEKKR